MTVPVVQLPPARGQDWRRWRQGLFGTPLNGAVTLATIAFLVWVVPPFVRWAVLDATWTGSADSCKANTGACWAFVTAKLNFILYAFYPPALHWRPMLVTILLLGLLVLTALPRFWRPATLLLWVAVPVVCWLLLAGTVIGQTVPSNQWGGLPVTLLVALVCFGLAIPLAIVLALARQSSMGGLRTMAVVFIEVMRGTPMVAILYIAMLILPMMVPGGQLIDKLARAMILITLFWSAYVAEVVRAGLQAIPAGQYEAARALGLGYWRIMRLVVLPQALRLVIPALVNLAIGFFLATSLLAVIGIFDLLNAAKNAAVDPNWLGFYDESYLVAASIYFVICLIGSRYSLWLESRLRRDHGVQR
ncbi:amino acid ABC transporter permease [uncultured Devosia sp.]|uniref:amino acid ABC transporter permease n=1 Tax=uncultured Devosia sp. TaxID=211434 RepID=UPI0035C9DCF2